MSNIQMKGNTFQTVSLPAIFVDHYMCKASGEYVKVYLYFLRYLQTGLPVNTDMAADALESTQADIYRALRYWEKESLLSLDFTGNILTAISFLPPAVWEETDTPAYQEALTPVTPVLPEKKDYTADELSRFKDTEDVSQLFFIIEQYLGRPLSASDMNTILYFYDALKFNTELIEYLIEYCVSSGHVSMHYIEKVALSWKEKNISSVKEAKENAVSYNKDAFAVLKAYGIKNRHPVPVELEFINRWLKEYGFDMTLITEACSRTIKKIHQPSFEYTDSILKSWMQKGIHHLSDLSVADAAYVSSTKPAQTAKQQHATSNNRFHNFEQRDYDYDALERELLHN